ncbi:MAG: hypothetical protein IPM24_28455, partial [Bryobacterales bacterium]|nr:hypothetical protein [Bryobacterales bacterium]
MYRNDDIGGNAIRRWDGLGHEVTATTEAYTNHSMPSRLTANGAYEDTVGYTSWLAFALAPETPNLATRQMSYDFFGRPATATGYDGATTTFSYTISPPTQTATLAGRWTKTTLDGLGRTVKVERGDGGGTKSIVDTEYAACACSPVGKVKRVSQPYAPGGPVYWT